MCNKSLISRHMHGKLKVCSKEKDDEMMLKPENISVVPSKVVNLLPIT